MSKYSHVFMNEKVEKMLSECPYRSNRLDEKVVCATKIGTQIRDGLVKPIDSPLLKGLGFDGDVDGVDVEPNEPKN